MKDVELLLYGYKIQCKALDYTAEFELFAENNGEWESECTGTIKWDGCSNFNSQVLHFCGLDHFERFSKTIAFCYEFARSNIKEWMDL